MTLSTFTLVHVIISLIGIGSGLVVLYGLLAAKPLNGITAIFLLSTVLTSVTGFLFPFHGLLPSHKVGIISLVLLAIAILARYSFHLAGAWRSSYVVGAVLALYLNCFVLVAQLFGKVPALHALAPTGKEPAFLATQLTLLALFVALTILAAKRFKIANSSPDTVRRQVA